MVIRNALSQHAGKCWYDANMPSELLVTAQLLPFGLPQLEPLSRAVLGLRPEGLVTAPICSYTAL